MTIVIKQAYETQIFINGADEVSILQVGSGYDEESRQLTDQYVSFPIEYIDSVVKELVRLQKNLSGMNHG